MKTRNYYIPKISVLVIFMFVSLVSFGQRQQRSGYSRVRDRAEPVHKDRGNVKYNNHSTPYRHEGEFEYSKRDYYHSCDNENSYRYHHRGACCDKAYNHGHLNYVKNLPSRYYREFYIKGMAVYWCDGEFYQLHPKYGYYRTQYPMKYCKLLPGYYKSFDRDGCRYYWYGEDYYVYTPYGFLKVDKPHVHHHHVNRCDNPKLVVSVRF